MAMRSFFQRQLASRNDEVQDMWVLNPWNGTARFRNLRNREILPS